MTRHVTIIGSGIGGATMAASLAPSGVPILILEKGEQLMPGPECRDDVAIFAQGRFQSDEVWQDQSGKKFSPGNYYYVGGNSKFYGAVMMRLRREDFDQLAHLGGLSPAWPISYDDLEPWYQKAEQLYEVRGDPNQDPTEPDHSGHYDYAPIAHEPSIHNIVNRLRSQGLLPFSLPLAVDLEEWLADGATPWDAYPNTGKGKKDAESAALQKALSFPNVRLMTGREVRKLVLDESGQRVSSILVDGPEGTEQFSVDLLVLSAGAVQSSALLLRSACDQMPDGLANRSDSVGRYFMNHNCTAMLAIDPRHRNDAVYQKTLGLNDFYLRGGPGNCPLGNVQLLGKISGTILQSATSLLPAFFANWISRHSVDWYIMSEDLPRPESRVSLASDGTIILNWTRSNMRTHHALASRMKSILRRAGYPIILSRLFDGRTPSHQCGTVRFGTNPQTSALDRWCRSHDHDNLFVVDASFMPSSAAVNPSLTIAAQAMRVADHIEQKDLGA